MQASVTGLDVAQAAALLEASHLRANGEGIEPTSLGEDVDVVVDAPTPVTAHYDQFTIFDTATGENITVESSRLPTLPSTKASVAIAAVGRRFGNVVITGDNHFITIGADALGQHPSDSTVNVIAQSLRAVGSDSLITMMQSARSVLVESPALRSIVVGADTIVVRGVEAAAPEAVCLRRGSAEACRADVRDGRQAVDPAHRSIRSVVVNGQWVVFGYWPNGSTSDGVAHRKALCSLDTATSYRPPTPLAATRVDDGADEYFVVDVPDAVVHVTTCVVVGDEVRVGPTRLLDRPEA
jgi:hypothetical protein